MRISYITRTSIALCTLITPTPTDGACFSSVSLSFAAKMISQARESRSDISPISLRVNLDSTKIHGHIGPEGAANFLGLQYATIPQRFRKAQLLPLETRGNDIDGTQYGPRCPQPPNLNVALRSHLYDGLRYPSSSTLPTSELDCLNLNVYCPAPATISSQQLPVVVWIHGGGFIFGDGGSEYGA